jgi:hypothetical protein
MTDQEINQAFQNLVERVNRIEATVAHNKPVAENEPAISAIDKALVLMDRVQDSADQSNKLLGRILDELQSGR